jgi:hypothetical protein
MKADFVAEEMVFNIAMQGRIMWVENEENVDEKKIVAYVKLVPRSPVLMVTFTDGETVEMNRHKSYTFEVNDKLQWKKATRRQIRSSYKNM